MMRVLNPFRLFRWLRSVQRVEPQYDDILATLADTLRQPVQGVVYTSRDPWDYPGPSQVQEEVFSALSPGQLSGGPVTQCLECARRREAERQRKERSRQKRKKRSRDSY